MKRRDPHPFRPDRVRVSPEDQFEQTIAAARAAQAVLRDPQATVVVVVARVLEGEPAVSLQAAIGGGCDATYERLVQSGPGYLEDFFRREVKGRLPS